MARRTKTSSRSRGHRWWRRIKIALWTVLGLLLTLIVAVLAVSVWALKHPREAWEFADKHLLPDDLDVKWEKMEFQPRRTTWLKWEIQWSTEKLKIEKKSPELDVPVKDAGLTFSLRIFDSGPWFHFQEIRLHTDKIRVKTQPSEKEEKTEESPFETLRGYIGYLETARHWVSVDKFDVEVPEVSMASGPGEPLVLRASLKKETTPEEAAREAKLKVDIELGEIKAGLEGKADTLKLGSAEPFYVGTIGAAAKTWSFKADSKMSFDGQMAVLTLDSEASYGEEGKAIHAKPKIGIAMRESGAEIKMESAVRDIPGPLVKLDKLQAEAQVPFDNGFAFSERPMTFKIWTPVELFFVDKNMRPPLEKSCRCKIPESLVATLDGRMWLQRLMSNTDSRQQVVDSTVRIEGVKNRLFTADIGAHVRLDKEKEQFLILPRLDSDLVIHSFKGVINFLDAKNIMIPAPLDVLDGKIHVSARGPVDREKGRMTSAIEATANLSSENQKVDVQTTVNLDLAENMKSLDVFIHSLINELRLELPPLDPVLGIPPMTHDSRVLMQPAPEKQAGGMRLRIFFDVKTAAAGSIKLLSKLADPYAPVSVSVNNAAAGESAGFVRLEPFTITYLRRKVFVERFQVTLAEDEDGNFPIGGRFRIDQGGYKIFIDLAGTSGGPAVSLNSEPFLPRNEIISVLLYGHTSDSLGQAEAETTGSFDAALADKAIGIFGLWAFASTPIQSFSYNPVTKVYTATVKLGEGLTAGVGTNWERAALLEVRKRVSRRWVLTASWSPTESREQVGKLVLQWEKRF